MSPHATRWKRLWIAGAGLAAALSLAAPDSLRAQSSDAVRPATVRTPLQGGVRQDDPARDDPAQLASDIYHELAIIVGTPPRSHERVEDDFARFDRQLHRGNVHAKDLDPCVEKFRAAKPHVYRAAELFPNPQERNKEAKIGGGLLSEGAQCLEYGHHHETAPTPDENGGWIFGQPSVSPAAPPTGGPGGGRPPRPGSAGGPGPVPTAPPDPCRPFGPGGYDYCNNPEGTRRPPGCVCGGPRVAAPDAAPSPPPQACANVPSVEEQTQLRRTGIELLDTLASGGQQTSIFLDHASRAALAGVAQMLHPEQIPQAWARNVSAVVDFLGNQDASKWVGLRDGAASALGSAARDPSGFLGDQAGAFVAGRVTMSLTTVPACRLNPNAARQLAEKAAKTNRAARNATRLEKIADVPGDAPPCGIAKKADCFWRAMRDATGDPAFDKLLNGPGVASWNDAFNYMAKYFGGKVPGVQDLEAHVLGLPENRSLDDILTKDLAKKGSEGIVFARFQNGENHVLMGANLTGSASFFDDQKRFMGAELSQKTVEQAYGDRVAQWKFYKTR